jgi:hypothetical protein
MISEEGKAYVALILPFWEECKSYVKSRAKGTEFVSPLKSQRLGDDLGLYIPHLAAYLFYFTEMAEGSHDDAMAFIGTGMDEAGNPKVIDRDLVNSYGAIRQMFEDPGMEPIRRQMGKEELIFFVLGTFPGKSVYTNSPINPELQDPMIFLVYVDAMFSYLNKQRKQRHDEMRAVINKGLEQIKTTKQKPKGVKVVEQKPKGACFVATAVYKDANHPRVNALRRWRDGALSQSVAGRAFIRLYYRIGPYLAQGVERFPRSRRVLRRVLETVLRLVNP